MRERAIRQHAQYMGLRNIGGRPGWVTASCPFAPTTHASGTDSRPSFGIAETPFGAPSYFVCQSCHQSGALHELPLRLASLGIAGTISSAIRAQANILETELQYGLPDYDTLPESLPEMQPLSEALYNRVYPSANDLQEPREYLDGRGVSIEATASLGLRYDLEQERVLFPVYGVDEKLYGFTGRAIYDHTQPKIRDYAGLQKRRLLLGAHVRSDKPILVVEGLIGLARLVTEKFESRFQVVAVMGSVLTKFQASILIGLARPVYLMSDLDEAGEVFLYGARRHDDANSRGAIEQLKDHLPVHVVVYPEGVDDVDDIIEDDMEFILENSEFIH